MSREKLVLREPYAQFFLKMVMHVIGQHKAHTWAGFLPPPFQETGCQGSPESLPAKLSAAWSSLQDDSD